MARDDFPADVKRVLAERVGYRCAFPECGVLTTGPLQDGAAESNRTGMACHIHAASDRPPARRISPGGIDRASATNGIWMCFRHGKMIDGDEATYTVEQLLAWKQIAELQADYLHRANRDPTTREYVAAGVSLPVATLDFERADHGAARIEAMLLTSGASSLWGRERCHALRDLTVELIRNALTHGGAATARVSLTSDSLTVEDDGGAFDVFELPTVERPQGGALALQAVLRLATGGVLLSSRRHAARNITTVTLDADPEHSLARNPCVVPFDLGDERAIEAIKPTSGCAKTYLLLENTSYSDIGDYVQAVLTAAAQGGMTAVLQGCSQGVIAYFKARCPDVEILAIEYPQNPWR